MVMKKIIFILFIASISKNYAQNREVQKTIEDFFVAFHAKDSVKLKEICSNKIILQSIEEQVKGAKISEVTASKFYKSIATIPNNVRFNEKILSYTIQVDGAMAHAWTPYEFYVNDKLSHQGVNAFTLFKENDIWEIIFIIDTRRK